MEFYIIYPPMPSITKNISFLTYSPLRPIYVLFTRPSAQPSANSRRCRPGWLFPRLTFPPYRPHRLPSSPPRPSLTHPRHRLLWIASATPFPCLPASLATNARPRLLRVPVAIQLPAHVATSPPAARTRR